MASPCMSSHPLHPLTFGGKTLRNPKVGTKFHAVLLHRKLASFFNNLMATDFHCNPWQDFCFQMSNLCCNKGPFLVDKIKLFDGFIHTESPDKLSNVPHLLVRVLHTIPHVTHIGRPVLAVWLPHPLIVRRPVEKSSCAFHR